jgi:catechol 2,3-dioxygenase-like lactoylglutathione lyase family enzyme
MTSATLSLPGIHHVTAITADPQKNIDFYCGILGLRLVKLTVNFDDPGSYHLYYGDEIGRPGTILTFFAWPGAQRGRIGPPQVSVTAYAAPDQSLDYWENRLREKRIATQPVLARFGERVLGFSDPDGMGLEITGVKNIAASELTPWSAGPIPPEHALRGFHSVTLQEEGYENTARLLTNTMHFTNIGSEQNRFRYRASGGNETFASTVDLICAPGARHGSMGAGVVHHIAFRTPDDDRQKAWRSELAARGFNVSQVMDRTYFHSIYYREPGGVLFEIATSNPGFTVDQPVEQLGTNLMLPKWLEPHRQAIEAAVPPLKLPTVRPSL